MYSSDDIFDMDGDEKQAFFEEWYFSKFGRLAHPDRDACRNEMMEEMINSENFLAEDGQEIFKKALKAGSNAAITNMADTLVAREVVKGTVKGVVDQVEKRGAVFTIEQSGRLTVAKGAHAAVKGIKVGGKIGAFIPSISAASGQMIAEKCTKSVGIENYHAKNALGVVGAAAGGAAAGGVIGNVPGAAAGAVFGVAQWLSDKGIYAVATRMPGPNDNCCYIKTGMVDGEICTGTYSPKDTLYWKTYRHEYRGSKCDEYFMSAGQGRKKSFQLTVWDCNNRVVTHLQNVYYRDLVHIGKNKRGRLCVAHGKGENWGSSAGSVVIYHHNY